MIVIEYDRAGGLGRLLPAVESHVADALAAVAGDIRDEARERVLELRAAARPLPSELAESIAVAGEADGLSGADALSLAVRADAAHAGAVEFGTRHMPPRPFLMPAAEGARASFAGRVARALLAAFQGWRP